MDSNLMRFNADGSFRILQVSDPQDLVHARRAMLQMLDTAYDTLKPDLVLFTGDNTLGNHLLDVGPFRIRSVNCPGYTLRQLRRSLKNVLEPVNRRGIPFAMIYGNHDDMNDVSKEEQFELYRAYGCCLPMNETDKSVDLDTYNIPVCSADGKTVWNIYMLDSAWNDADGQHCLIKKETVRWYKRTSERLKTENGGMAVPSLMFMHIPLPQISGLLKQCPEGSAGAVSDNGKYVCLDTKKARGVLGEPVSPCEDPYGLYTAVKEQGDVRAVISGHDHSNCFDGEEGGVRFIQSGAASFRCYGSKVRGVRLFVLREDDTEGFETEYYTYDMLRGTGLRSRARYFWDADDRAAEKYGLLGGAAVLGAGAAAAAVLRSRRRKK